MRVHQRKIRPTGSEADQSETLVRVDSDHTAQTDKSRDLLPGAGGA